MMISKWLVATEVPAHLRLVTYEARVKEIVTKNRILVHISYFEEKMLGLVAIQPLREEMQESGSISTSSSPCPKTQAW